MCALFERVEDEDTALEVDGVDTSVERVVCPVSTAEVPVVGVLEACWLLCPVGEGGEGGWDDV